jgi:radical SAM superfamily enzyme YgiQ (UPF0313 family)
MQYSDRVLLVSINSKYIQSNTAVYYLHEILKSGGIDSSVLSHNINEDFHDVLSSIMNSGSAIICFSCYIWNISIVYDLCSALRCIDRGIKIVLGGPEVSFEPEEALEKSDADLIVRGEGETVILEAVKGLITGNLPDIPGLYYMNENKLIDTGYATTKNLSDVPFPFTQYMMEQEKDKLLYYESSRGCPFNCIYCLSSATKGVRYFSLDRVKNEILKILEYKPKVIKFTDRSFNSDYKRATLLLEFIGCLNTKTCFHLEIYPGEMNEEMIVMLGKMPEGRVQIEAGIQSTDEKVLIASGRPQDPGRALGNLKRIMEKGNLHVHLDLIAGLPGDSRESFKKSFNETIGVLPHKLQMGFLKLLKGTKARLIEGYKHTDIPPYEVLASDSMNYQQIQGLREVSGVLESFYNSGHFREFFRYSIVSSENPFNIFEGISRYMKAQSINGTGISRDGKYRILADLSKCDSRALNLLGYDYLSSFRTKVLPSFLQGQIVGKEETFDFLRKNSEGEARQLFKSCTIAQFTINECKVTYLFDYTRRNPVTGLFHSMEVEI